jgi:hypothetical protein
MNLSMLNPATWFGSLYVKLAAIVVVLGCTFYGGLHFGNMRCDSGKYQALSADLARQDLELLHQRVQLVEEYASMAAKLRAQQAATEAYQSQRAAEAARADALQQEINREQFAKSGTAVCSADLNRVDFGRLYDAAAAGGLPAASASAPSSPAKG